MELTKEQLQQVEHYLHNKYLDYVDLKSEILDHIVSDIENLMAQNISFENAFKTTILKWNIHFKETSSFYFGMYFTESKIVIQKAVKVFKPFYFIYLTAYILPAVILHFFPVQFSESVANFTNNLLQITTVFALIYVLYIAIKTKLSKVKTTYSFIIRTQYLASVFLILVIFMGDFFNEKLEMTPFLVGFAFAGFSVTYICHHFYKKHQQAIHQYKIL